MRADLFYDVIPFGFGIVFNRVDHVGRIVQVEGIAGRITNSVSSPVLQGILQRVLRRGYAAARYYYGNNCQGFSKDIRGCPGQCSLNELVE